MVDNLSFFVSDARMVHDTRVEEVQATDLCFVFTYDDDDIDDDDSFIT